PEPLSSQEPQQPSWLEPPSSQEPQRPSWPEPPSLQEPQQPSWPEPPSSQRPSSEQQLSSEQPSLQPSLRSPSILSFQVWLPDAGGRSWKKGTPQHLACQEV